MYKYLINGEVIDEVEDVMDAVDYLSVVSDAVPKAFAWVKCIEAAAPGHKPILWTCDNRAAYINMMQDLHERLGYGPDTALEAGGFWREVWANGKTHEVRS
jgi:hypothetical protein